MAQVIEDQESPIWKKLYKLWIQQGKPGWVVLGGGDQYRVLRPDDDNIKFEKGSGFDDYYGSQSKGVG